MQKQIDLQSNEYGLEREMLRVVDFENSTYPHPTAFGLKEENSYITVDFAQNQLEVVSPTFLSIEELGAFNEGLYDIAASELHDDEILWPFSMPCDLSRNLIPASFEKSKRSGDYRKYLFDKYDVRKQFISGVHFNFSFSNETFLKLYELTSKQISFKEFKNGVYLKILNNYRYYKFLVTVFTSASPIAHKSFGDTHGVFSIRTSKYGYRNLEEIKIDYSSVPAFIASVNAAVASKLIIDEREIYDDIRIKNGSKLMMQSLEETGIKYLEIRNIDINPYFKGGVNLRDLKFIEIILLYCLFTDLKDAEKLDCDFGNKQDVYECRDVIFKEMQNIKTFCQTYQLKHCHLIDEYLEEFSNNNILALRVKAEIEQVGFRAFGEALALKYKESAYHNRFKFVGFENMELSTQLLIKESVKRGVKVEIIDKHDNFLRLSSNNRVELIKQCTKTNKDGYASVLAMENKVVTKNILRENAIRVPEGKEFTDEQRALSYALELGQDFVIKPKSTNFGIGISIFRLNVIEKDVVDAIKLAFEHDQTILIEEFISGIEYRFLVIDDSVAGILNRVPANVIGDGVHTIEELVEIKNQNSLRGVGYVTPLEKIKIDDSATYFLNAQGLSKTSVIEKDQQIFLRENSNISTGGDSIDFTDEVDPFFKELAIEATKAFDIKFCGVDIMIEDISDPSSAYGIIELNFNPAIHIHSYPFIGKERNIAYKILDALELV